MNYKIVQDEDLLRKFIEWLPELKKDEVYLVCLFARSKYSESVKLSSDKSQLKRFTASKEFLFDKIKQLECEVGSYKQKGDPIPQEALALYITPNPRSHRKASIQLVKDLIGLVTDEYSGYNPHQLALTAIQQSCGSKKYFDMDFDHITIEEIVSMINADKIINLDALTFVKTRGGFHMLIETERIDPEFKKSWYNDIKKLPGCDVRGDNLLPVVGCSQGGFIPHFVNTDSVLIDKPTDTGNRFTTFVFVPFNIESEFIKLLEITKSTTKGKFPRSGGYEYVVSCKNDDIAHSLVAFVINKK